MNVVEFSNLIISQEHGDNFANTWLCMFFHSAESKVEDFQPQVNQKLTQTNQVRHIMKFHTQYKVWSYSGHVDSTSFSKKATSE